MQFKQKIIGKLLKRSNSYNYYKNNYQTLNKYLENLKNQINTLNMELKNKTIEINELKDQLVNKEEGFIFSIIIPIYNTEKYLAESIDSVLNQSFRLDKVQIILLDDGSTDKSASICKSYVKKYPNNIKYIYQENQGSSVARNNGLKFADGKFVNFLDSDDKLEPNTLDEIYYYSNKFGDEVDVISILRYCFDAFSGPMPFFEKFTNSRIVNIDNEFDFPQTPVNSVFLRRKVALNFQFNKRVIISEDSLFVNKIILEKGKFGVVDSVKYLYSKRHEENSLVDTKKFDKRYFNPRMELYFKELINYSIEKYGSVIKYIQSVLMYDLKWFFLQNTLVNVLNEKELKKFHNHVYDVLQVIDDDIILSQDFNEELKSKIINLKYGIEEIL